jgi:hypothetical protein
VPVLQALHTRHQGKLLVLHYLVGCISPVLVACILSVQVVCLLPVLDNGALQVRALLFSHQL